MATFHWSNMACWKIPSVWLLEGNTYIPFNPIVSHIVGETCHYIIYDTIYVIIFHILYNYIFLSVYIYIYMWNQMVKYFITSYIIWENQWTKGNITCVYIYIYIYMSWWILDTTRLFLAGEWTGFTIEIILQYNRIQTVCIQTVGWPIYHRPWIDPLPCLIVHCGIMFHLYPINNPSIIHEKTKQILKTQLNTKKLIPSVHSLFYGEGHSFFSGVTQGSLMTL